MRTEARRAAPHKIIALKFCRRYPAFQPLVLWSPERVGDPITGVRLMAWTDFLLGKPLPQ